MAEMDGNVVEVDGNVVKTHRNVVENGNVVEINWKWKTLIEIEGNKWKSSDDIVDGSKCGEKG